MATPASLSYVLFYPSSRGLEEWGFGSVAHVPCIFDSEWRYQKEASLYLRERALCRHQAVSPPPESRSQPLSQGRNFRRKRFPTKKSLRAFGESLTNFLEWCSANGVAWQDLDYTNDIAHGYQRDMLAGRWSVDGKPRKARTVNARVGEACNFLEWAANRGLREEFGVLTNIVTKRANSGTSTQGHKSKTVEQRVGWVRPDPVTLRLPTDLEVNEWHRSVRIESGITKALMCELVLDTAVRREEAVQWRIDTLPLEQKDWSVVGDSVDVIIKYGTKGAKSLDANGDEVGPARNISIPLKLAIDIHRYREEIRPMFWAKYVRAAPSEVEKRRRKEEPSRLLFLSDFTGEPVSAQRFYDAWTKASRLPYAGWSPHIGRHWWVCKKLIDGCILRLGVGGAQVDYGEGLGAVHTTARDLILLVIKPQLGHINEETVQKYLVLVTKLFLLASLHDAYGESLESVATTFETN